MAITYKPFTSTTQIRGRLSVENVTLSSTGDDLIISIKHDDGSCKEVSLLSVIDRLDQMEKNMAELILLGVKNG